MDGLHTELALGLLACGGGEQLQTTTTTTAPFVAKTYQMVCDGRTDALVRWGRDNNSFVVADPAGFSRLLLPCFFKHSNFSSFVRQLNTYGFRKVHPDRWEFAHESFLRGQTHLLPRIVRRKKLGEGWAAAASSCSSSGGDAAAAAARCIAASEDHHYRQQEEEGREDEEALLEEVQRLRQEQSAIGEDLARMSRRLQATERRPDQLMSFLARLADDPDGVTRHLVEQAAEKKRRRMQLQLSSNPISPIPPAPPPLLHHHPLLALGGGGAAAAWGCDDGGWQWAAAEQKPSVVIPTFDHPAPPVTYYGGVVPDFGGGNGGGAGSIIGMGLTAADETAVETPFPFCLLGQGFF